MARLRYLDRTDLAPEDQDLLDRPTNLNRILVHSPKCRRAALGLPMFIRHASGLDPRLREIGILVVGYLARSPYEWSHHLKFGLEYGVSDADIHELIKAADGQESNLDAAATIVVAAAREMTKEGAVSAATFDALRGHLSDKHVIDLVVALAHYNGVVRLLATLDVDLERDQRTYLIGFRCRSLIRA